MAVGRKKRRVEYSQEGPAGRSRRTAYCLPPTARPSGGWTLIELMITVTVMAVLALGAIPMLKVAVRRQKEQQLRESLRTMREAIKEFRRDTIGMQCAAGGLPGGEAGPVPAPSPGTGAGGAAAPATLIDPRSKVVIADCTIFGVDNPDHYPPDLETLVQGVNVLPRASSQAQATGSVTGNFLDRQQGALATKKKVYLRAIPEDPITGQKDWVLCSSWETQDSDSCGGKENVFDVRSRSRGVALNGKDKYSDW